MSKDPRNAPAQIRPLPCDTCGGKCCTAAPFRPSELRAARLANGGHYPPGARVINGIPVRPEHGGGTAALVAVGDRLTCAFLRDGRCSIYDARPLVCRLLGTVHELPCPEVEPVRAERLTQEWLTRQKAVPRV